MIVVSGRVVRVALWVANGAITVVACRVLAGGWDVPWVWATVAVALLVYLPVSLAIDPGLARERRRPGPGGVDRITVFALATCMVAESLIAILDVSRFHWSDHVPAWAHIVAIGLFALGFGVVAWAVSVNRFFSSVVRIQTDRGHQLVTAGPYRYVRHPGYLGMLLAYPVIGVAIGSWYALIPGIVSVVLVFRRMRVEDRYLMNHLPGYKEYATNVPRLIPRRLW